MATYYISPSGNDTTGNGSEVTPWRSLTKVLTAPLAHGDVVMAAAGDYTPAGTITTNISGGNATPLEIRAIGVCTYSIPAGAGYGILPSFGDYILFTGPWVFSDTANRTNSVLFSSNGSKIKIGAGAKVYDVATIAQLNNASTLELDEAIADKISIKVAACNSGGGTLIIDDTVISRVGRVISESNPINLYVKGNTVICGSTNPMFDISGTPTTSLIDIQDSALIVGGTGYDKKLFNFSDAAATYFKDNPLKFVVDGNRVWSLSADRDATFFNIIINTSSTVPIPLVTYDNWFSNPGITESIIASGVIDKESVSFGKPSVTLNASAVGLCGDSIMAGFNATEGNRSYEVLRTFIADPVVDPASAAIGGIGPQGLFWALDMFYDSGAAPKLYLFACGINNIVRSTGAFAYCRSATELADMMQLCTNKHLSYGGTVGWLGCLSNQAAANTNVIAYNDEMQSRCAAGGIQYFDLLTEFQTASATWNDDYYADLETNVHPNNAGHYRIADTADRLISRIKGRGEWGQRAACDASLPTDGQIFADHTLPISARKITVWPGVASQAQINEAKE